MTPDHLVNKQPIEQYLIAAPTRMFRHDETIYAFKNPNVDSLQILTDRIKKFNAKFIRYKYGLRLGIVFQFILKMVKYAPLEERGWQRLLDFITKKQSIIYIQNKDHRCFRYALLYFFEHERLPEKFCHRASVLKNKCFGTTIWTLSPN